MTDKTLFELEDFYNFKFLMNLSVSPDGYKIAYVLATYHDKEKKKDDEDEFPKEERTNIWILDTKSKAIRQYTYGKMNNNPTWSPDGKKLAFTSKREEESQLYLLEIDGGEAQPLTTTKLGVSSQPVWSPDGKKLAFSASSLEKKPDLKKPYRYTRDFYRFDGAGNVNHFKGDIFVLDVATKEVQQLTSDSRNHDGPRWSPDGSKLLWFSSFADKGVDVFQATLSVYHNNIVTDHLAEWGYTNNADWISNDDIIVLGQPKGRMIGTKDDIFRYNLKDKTIECRSTNCSLGIGGGLEAFLPGRNARMSRLLVKDNLVYTTIQNRGKLSIYSFSLTGEEQVVEVVGGERACFSQALIDDTIFFTSSNHLNPLDIFSFSLSTSQEEQLTFTNKELMDKKKLPAVKRIDVPGVDGVGTDGFFLLPEGPAPYPTLLKIHGGPHSAYGYIFYWDALLLCSKGYAVLMVNHRGSTGYGDDFATAINGDWGNLDFKDLMAGVDTGINLGLVNGDRLGCFGISGGGNLSSWIVGNTDRFKAAVPENPLTNWLSFYGVSDIGRWFSVEELGGLPHEVPDKYVKCSPITYAHNAKTPTLMIQHDNDLRCPVEQTEQFYAVLRDAGCVVEMLRMPGTPHSGSILGPLEIREARSKALLDWFGKYV